MTASLDSKQVHLACKALAAYLVKSRAAGARDGAAADLFEDDATDVTLQVVLRRIPDRPRAKPIRIPLKHSIFGVDGREMCLFTKDPVSEYREVLEDHPVRGLPVKNVLGMKELRQEFKQYQDKRRLCSLYDLFLVDERVMPMLPQLIGKTFFKKKKQPAPVKLNFRGPEAGERRQRELCAARDSTYMFISGGATLSIRIGRTDFEPEQVAENILFAIDKIVGHVPKKWQGVQAFYIKTPSSVAIPIWQGLPSMDNVISEEEAQSKRKKNKGKKGGKAAAAAAAAAAKANKGTKRKLLASAGADQAVAKKKGKAASKGKKKTA